MRIAIIGLGAIGQALLKCLEGEMDIEVCSVLVANPAKPRPIACPALVPTIDELLGTRPDLVVECASQAAVREHGCRVLSAGCSLLVTSVGALAEPSVLASLRGEASRSGTQIFVPSGALVGIDALAAARRVGLASVRYERRAPPSTWLRSGAITSEATAASGPFEVYSGSAREAALRFPKNANVAATIALAGVGFEATRVVLIADPAHPGNTHAIHAEGAFGEFRTEISARTLSATSTSSMIVAGSLARAVTAHADRIVV